MTWTQVILYAMSLLALGFTLHNYVVTRRQAERLKEEAAQLQEAVRVLRRTVPVRPRKKPVLPKDNDGVSDEEFEKYRKQLLKSLPPKQRGTVGKGAS